MSRRQDREGVMRYELQRRRNLECDPENHRNERGWYVPHLAWEGWEEFNRSCYALRRYTILRGYTAKAEMLHDVRWSLQASKVCERPRIP